MSKYPKAKSYWSLTSRMRLGLVLLFMPVLMLGGIYYLHMSRSLQEALEQRLGANNDQLRESLVEPYLAQLERQFTLIYGQVKAEDLAGSELAHTGRYLHDWRLYKALAPDLVAIYLGTERRQVLAYPIKELDPAFDPRTRPWYQLAFSQPGSLVWTEPYYDYTSGNLLISMAKMLIDQEGKPLGVFAVDARLQPLSALLNRPGEDGYQSIVNGAGRQLAHPDPEQLFKVMAHPGWLKRARDDKGLFLDEGKGQFVAYSHLPEQGWLLLSVKPAASLIETVSRASFNVQLMVGLACVLYLVLALVWTRYFRRVLNEVALMIRHSRQDPMAARVGGIRELKQVYAELAAASQDLHEVRQLANQDKLTGLYNRRFFDDRLTGLLEAGEPFFLAMFDLDDFKAVNDTFGHHSGDMVLKRVATLAREQLGERGWVCRYGGEELVALLTGDDQAMIFALLDEFRERVAALVWRESGLRVTLSGGLVASTQARDAMGLIMAADAEVYRAKRAGKNRCYQAGETPPEPLLRQV
ncbi:diguanylate cyclase [Aeromonas bivalvium]|uniref:sensor domain-containing diguanylate cyclase n=1 Tax=Aeromonas bivalvium TaxID=440079 RepID=UPI00370B5577